MAKLEFIKNVTNPYNVVLDTICKHWNRDISPEALYSFLFLTLGNDWDKRLKLHRYESPSDHSCNYKQGVFIDRVQIGCLTKGVDGIFRILE